MKSGIYDLGRKEYEQIDGANFSTLKHFARSPAHGFEAMHHPPEPTDALEFGNAVHLAIFEPERLAKEYAVLPAIDRRTKEGKAEWARFEAEHPGRSYLNADKWMALEGIRKSVDAFSAQQVKECGESLLSGEGKVEVAVVWTDAETGVLCKGRLDRFGSFLGHSIVVDLKTTEDARPFAFARSCAKFSYHAQSAMYVDGLASLSPRERRFVHVVVEKSPPFAVAAYELDDEAIAHGRTLYRSWLKQFKECKESGIWPAYPAGINPLALPSWATRGESE